jgi:4-hydroxyphenylpyruvate dioxygenase
MVKNPINEPYEGMKKSQIEEYIDEYFGSGIQHVAITTANIIATIKAMRKWLNFMYQISLICSRTRI